MRAGGRRVTERTLGLLAVLCASLALMLASAAPRHAVWFALATVGSMAVLLAGVGLWRYWPDLRRALVPMRNVRRNRAVPDFEELPVALLRISHDGTVGAANAAARQLVGPVTWATRAHDLFEDLGRPVADWISEVATGRHPGGSEVLRLRHAKEADCFAQVTARRLGSDEVIAVLQDATAMKRLEAQFTQSQKMQAIGQLAGGIAHDFNNLLTAITGHCDLLLLRHRPDDLDHADLQQIQQNAYRAGALVRQLLAFSRKQTLAPERIELTEVLGDLTHLLNRLLGKSVRLDLQHAPVNVALRADKRQFEQVIINLAVNARDAMPMGGLLQISTDLVTLDSNLHRDKAVLPAGRYAVIRLRDSGTGIPDDIVAKIFEPFFTTKRTGEGTGLGLSTVYGIVKQSGGYVFVESTLGEGTEFHLWFPACTEQAPHPARQRPVVAHRAATEGVVLLVEDEAPVRAFAARALRLRGLTVIEADSGEQALELAGQPMQIDLFVTDVVLPGLDGPSWVREALESRPRTPVVFMSGYAADQPSAAQALVENSVFLSKPFTLAELSETVARHMPRRSGTDHDAALSVS